ncbi:MAG: DUF3048 domain-containing protein [bacterium]|nr:DUF3048 domain-containing protein [bacterium]
MKKNLYLYILAGVSLFIFTVGTAYLILGWIGGKNPLIPGSTTSPTAQVTNRRSKIDPNLPRTEICPLNGAKYSKPEKDIWEKRRPLAVMIENHQESRPVSGLSSADIIYEAVAEGGITRFMGIFYCGISALNETLAPVRSARIYYTQTVPEYDALYNHVGGAGRCEDPTVDERAKALCYISRNKIKDMDQFGLDFRACHRLTNRLDHDVAYEHTMACYTDELYKVAEKRGWTNVDANNKNVAWDKNFVPWKFKDEAATTGQAATSIKFDFWSSDKDYSVEWQFDSTANAYKRLNGGTASLDLNTNEQLQAKNVVIQFVKETGPVDEHKHILYEVIGKGKMILFQDGKAFTGTWSKASATGRTKYLLDNGQEVKFNRGQIWIEWIPAGNTVEYN